MKKKTLFLILFCLFLWCGIGFSSPLVSDTSSYLTIAETSVFADGNNRFTVTVFVRDGSNQPLQDKAVTIVTSRGFGVDSVTQPAVTDINGQCTGYVSSDSGGWDTVTALCDLETIASPYEWVFGTQEDFSSGDTLININTSSYPGTIRFVNTRNYGTVETDIPNNSFESGVGPSADSWTLWSYGTVTSVRILGGGIPHGSYSVYVDYCYETFGVKVQFCSVSDSVLSESTVNYCKVFDGNWYDVPIVLSNYKNQYVKLNVMTYDPTDSADYTTLLSSPFLCSGETCVFSYRKVIGGIYFDNFKGGNTPVETQALFVSSPRYCDIDTPRYNVFIADHNSAGQTVAFKVRSADSEAGLDISAWQGIANNAPIGTPRKKWFQWGCDITRSDTSAAPYVDTVTIYYRAVKSVYFVPSFKIENLSASPNPISPNTDTFKDTTDIFYDLVDSKPQDTISVRIYDSSRQLIRTLLNHVPQSVGRHTVQWGGEPDIGTTVPDGIYYCVVTAEDSLGYMFTETGTITVDLTKPEPEITSVELGKYQAGLDFDFDETLDNWQVLRSAGNTGSFIAVGSGANEQEWLDTGSLGNDQKYYYKVIATDLAGNTNTSNMVCAILAINGGIFDNCGQFALYNTVIKCKDDAAACVLVPDTQTFGATVSLVKIVISKKDKITLEAEGKMLPVDKKLVGAYEINACEVDASLNEVRGLSACQAGKIVRIVLHYDSCPPDKTGALSIYTWNGQQWLGLGGTVNTNTQTLELDINHFSAFAIMYPASGSFAGAKPNPFSPNNDGINDRAEIRFENPSGVEVRFFVFDLTGTTVRSENYSAGTVSIFWDGRDESGKVVEGGAYIWQVEMGTRVVNGVVVVAK